MSTVTLSKSWSYDRMMQLFGGMWFMLLALCVAIKIGASLTDPWPSLLSSFCLASFYMLLALLIMTRPPAKAQADGLLPRIAAFVGTYMPWTITFFGKTDQALPNLAVHRLRADRHDHDACHDPTSRSVVQFGTAGTFSGANRSLSMDQAPTLPRRRNRDTGCSAAIPDAGNGDRAVLHIGVQVCRILYEEDLLRRNLP